MLQTAKASMAKEHDPYGLITPLRFIGSKYRMLSRISEIMVIEGFHGKTFFDTFSGSAAVGRFFKRQFSVTSNDSLYFSYVLQKALIEINHTPRFSDLRIKGLSSHVDVRVMEILSYLNDLRGEDGFITQHYTPASDKTDGISRMYFSTDNGRRIDAMRASIEKWHLEGELDEEEYFYLIALLLLAVQRVANISGTYGAFNKTWDPRAKNRIELRFVPVISSPFTHMALNMDVFDTLDMVSTDIAYVDPPYNPRQYISNYHLLETIARYDHPKIHGKTGMRECSETEKSSFSRIGSAEAHFSKLLAKLKSSQVIVSYNSEGIMRKDEILGIMDGHFSSVSVYEYPFPRFKSSSYTGDHVLLEYLFTGVRG